MTVNARMKSRELEVVRMEMKGRRKGGLQMRKELERVSRRGVGVGAES